MIKVLYLGDSHSFSDRKFSVNNRGYTRSVSFEDFYSMCHRFTSFGQTKVRLFGSL